MPVQLPVLDVAGYVAVARADSVFLEPCASRILYLGFAPFYHATRVEVVDLSQFGVEDTVRGPVRLNRGDPRAQIVLG